MARFVLVTANSVGGMVDIQESQPVAVSADDARRLLNPKPKLDDAMHIACTAMLDTHLFE